MKKNQKGLLGFGIILAILIAGFLFFLPEDQPTILMDEAEDEIAYVRRFVPSVTVTNVSTDTLQTVGKTLVSGDTLTTNQTGYAMLLFLDETVARVSPSSNMVISSTLNAERDMNIRTQIRLAIGGLFMDVNRGTDREFEVTTSNTVASVKGTRFGIDSNDFIWVEQGEVEVTVIATGEVITLRNMSFVRVEEDGTAESGEITEDLLEELKMEYQILESDLIERDMRLRFRNQQGDTMDEQLRIFEQEQEN